MEILIKDFRKVGWNFKDQISEKARGGNYMINPNLSQIPRI
jgi:hypothetical protein